MIIHYEDDVLIAVEKPSGLFVHPSDEDGRIDTHLVKQVREHTGGWCSPINRLDRPVSGIVLFGKNSEVIAQVQARWHDIETQKEYICLCRGTLDSAGTFDEPIKDDNGVEKAALTHYWPLWSGHKTTLCRVVIESGRKHQIRRHFTRHVHNLVGDTTYGKGPINREFRANFALHRIFLHAKGLRFNHPVTNHPIAIISKLPPELINTLVLMGHGGENL
jgi:23S rRNA-/tRNA-specific pseudouridylate synthase